MTLPLISVLIDTYNYGRFVEEALDSVMAQDYPAERMEIIVVDDGSTDDTPERVAKYLKASPRHARIQYVRKENGGQASAFNSGIARAKGELVAFLDADDYWLPGKLTRVVEEFQKEPHAVMVYHKYEFWDPRENWSWEPGIALVTGDVPASRRKLLEYVAAPTSSLVFRREALERIGPIPEGLTFMADAFLVGTSIFVGPVGAVEECLAKNRVHGGNRWFAERGKPSAEVVRGRARLREKAILGLALWAKENVPRARRGQARLLLSLWRLLQETDEFQLERPGRWREFVHLCRHAIADGTTVSTGFFVYRWVHAFAVLIVGRHARYLEGVRTRIRTVMRRLGGGPNPAKRADETVGQP